MFCTEQLGQKDAVMPTNDVHFYLVSNIYPRIF